MLEVFCIQNFLVGSWNLRLNAFGKNKRPLRKQFTLIGRLL